MDWLKNIEVVMFDLDGTLYQDASFYKRYTELLFHEHKHEARVGEFLEDMASLLEGRHACSIGDWYHPGSDTWTRGSVEHPVHRDWNGQEVVIEPLPFSDIPSIYTGDAWSIVAIFAAKYGVDEAQRQRAFQQVRKEMLQGASSFERHQGLYDAIGQLTGVGAKLLMTNSPENTGSEFIAALGCLELFDKIVYGADKPHGIERYMKEIMERDGWRADQILSIGDHAWNDLYPVQKLGGRTIWLSPYPSSDPSQWDVTLSTLDELTDVLVDLQRVKQ